MEFVVSENHGIVFSLTQEGGHITHNMRRVASTIQKRIKCGFIPGGLVNKYARRAMPVIKIK